MARTKNTYNPVKKQKEEITVVSEALWNTALYARLSMEVLGRNESSIDSQLEIMKRHIADLHENHECREYIDRGYSGTNYHRPAFEEMMEDVRCGNINCIVVKDLSRLGRDYLETCNYIETIFPFLGIRFISVNDHFDTAREHGGNKELEVTLKNLVNDMYARDVSKRVSTTAKQNQERGKFLGRTAPYGYRIDETHPMRRLVIDPEAAEIVREIFELFLQGMTYREISLEFQKKGYSIPGVYAKTGKLMQKPGSEETHWYIGTISSIVTNVTYIGHLVQGKRRARMYKGEKRYSVDKSEWVIIENAHEPIISVEVFEAAQRLLEKKSEESSFRTDQTKDILIRPDKYKGILFCGCCGAALSYASQIRGTIKKERHYYYYCADRYVLGAEEKCGIHITEKTLDKILQKELGEILKKLEKNRHTITDLEAVYLANAEKKYDAALRKLQSKRQDLDAAGGQLYEDYVLGMITREVYLDKQEKQADKRAGVEESIKKQEQEKSEVMEYTRKKTAWLRHLKRAKEDELDKELLSLLIRRVDVYPGHELQITYPFSEQDFLAERGGSD